MGLGPTLMRMHTKRLHPGAFESSAKQAHNAMLR